MKATDRYARQTRCLVLVLAALLAGAIARPAGAQTATRLLVTDVNVVGNHRIATGQVLALVKTRPGTDYNPVTVEEDVRKLTDSRWFANAAVDLEPRPDGRVVVIFRVAEHPSVIEEIVYDGGSGSGIGLHMSEKDLEAASGLRKGLILNPAMNQRAAQAILDKYRNDKGRYFTTVQLAEGGKPGDRRVVFKITEGPVVKVSAIDFTGVHFVLEGRIRTLLNSSRAFLNTLGGQFNPMMVEMDVQKIEEYYKAFGFHDVRVSRELQWLDNYDRVKIVYHVDEGQRYRVKSLVLDGPKSAGTDQLMTYAKAKVGEYYDEAVVRADLNSMKDVIGYGGHEALVERKLVYYPGEVAVTYQVQERPAARVGEIIIVGNEHTRENVIRRQIGLYPGQILTYPDLRRAESNLARLNIFEGGPDIRPTVEVIDPDGPNEFKNLLVNVQETRTGSFMVGAGVNSDAGLTGSIVLNERNFDILRFPTSWEDFLSGKAFRGGGQEFRLEAVPGTQLQRYTASWREPFLFDSQFSLGVSGYYYTRQYTEDMETRLGTRITVGRRLNENWSVTGGIRVEQVGIHDVPFYAPPDYLSVLGDNFLLTFRGGLTYDNRDSYLRPTEGEMFEVAYEQAVGDFSYPMATAEASKYWTIFQRADGSGRHVIAAKSQVGFAGNNTPVFERFYAGGFRSIRGFEFRGVGPMTNGFAVGGDFLFLNSIEYQLPILANDHLYAVGFVDSGTVDTKVELGTYRVSAGLGLRIVVPMMGPVPIALDFGFPIVKADTDRTQVFSFWLGFFH